jgi:hypothetical protein
MDAHHRPAYDESAQGGEEEEVHERLALGAHARGRYALAQLVAVERPLVRERALDGRHAALGGGLAHALLTQPAGVAGEEGRGGQGVQPRVVLAADQVERAAVEPGDQQRAVVGERAIDVGPTEARAAGTHGQARPALVLPLDREQPLGHRHGVARRRPRQQLGGEAVAGQRW